jgi:hypothetical protein
MTPLRTMTGDTCTDEKTLQTPVSPTNTDDTLVGDASIQVEEDTCSTIQPSARTSSSIDIENAQPQEEQEKRSRFLRRVTEPFRSKPEPEFVTENRTRKLEETPNGFPRLAAFQASEANFSLYRSFSYLHSRILLDLQDEITTLEKELDEKEWDDTEENEHCLKSRDTSATPTTTNTPRTRRVILREIKDKLMEYGAYTPSPHPFRIATELPRLAVQLTRSADEVLIKSRTLESFQRPSNRNYRSLRRFCYNTKPLMDAEMDSLRCKEDMVSLHNGREFVNFDASVETMIGQLDHALQKVFKTTTPPLLRYFRTPEAQEKTTDENISLYSKARIDKVVNIFITLVIFALLVIPVITMYQLTNTAAHGGAGSTNNRDVNNRDMFRAVGVLMIFTLLFSTAMSLLTKAARYDKSKG